MKVTELVKVVHVADMGKSRFINQDAAKTMAVGIGSVEQHQHINGIAAHMKVTLLNNLL